MGDLNEPGIIERAIALAEIHATLGAYAVAARDSSSLEEKLDTLTPDAEIDLPTGLRMRFADFFTGNPGNRDRYFRHHVTSVAVRFTGKDTAEAISQIFAITGQATPDHWGEWRDTLVKVESGRWLIKEKIIVVDNWDPKGWYAGAFGSQTHRDRPQ
ncbi:hypothetical protein M409DRAFT_56569 [Zasmidium cellare ATCC 36951]|uniref:SnoaL-like domain-containing protein n=1 Tax=Zasmidium cellare ATCC 36951 TaxID=1080233 RepID=A0A6A6CB66_ZASCE|nr:uncharacterized protein M409DRAFT_56569 [Zasmidium cellare ATCC 36951]KAF2164281.1 hypothetical protein M409DRAFT_56569 [Zasmidium cellare ATCC 36951]